MKYWKMISICSTSSRVDSACRFENEDVFGIVGGRSGLLDVAAFVGVNCFSWDEAVLDICAGIGDPKWSSYHSKEYLDYQVPQYLRLLQQCSIMSIGLLDPDSFCNTSRNYLRLQKDHLCRWLEGERNAFPAVNVVADVVRLVRQQ